MERRLSSRLKTASKKLDQSPNPSEEVVQRRIQPKMMRRLEFDEGNINNEDESIRDIDIITSHVEEDPEEGSSVEVVDRGLDDSDEQCCSSTAPSPLTVTAPNIKKKTPTGLCPSCRKFYQRAKRLKTSIKDKLLDNDPTSLTCDQWVLLKKWKPSRLPHSGKLSRCVLLVNRHLKGKKKAKQINQDGHKFMCSRVHIFLQRNLKWTRKVPARKERKRNQRKRARDESQDSKIAKRKHRRGNNQTPDDTVNSIDNSSFGSTCASLVVDSFHSGKITYEKVASMPAHIPFTSPSETATLGAIPPKQKAPRKKRAFQDFLAQLRGNSSMIVKETQ